MWYTLFHYCAWYIIKLPVAVRSKLQICCRSEFISCIHLESPDKVYVKRSVCDKAFVKGRKNFQGDLTQSSCPSQKIYCQFSQTAVAQGFLLVREAILVTCHRSVVSRSGRKHVCPPVNAKMLLHTEAPLTFSASSSFSCGAMGLRNASCSCFPYVSQLKRSWSWNPKTDWNCFLLGSESEVFSWCAGFIKIRVLLQSGNRYSIKWVIIYLT